MKRADHLRRLAAPILLACGLSAPAVADDMTVRLEFGLTRNAADANSLSATVTQRDYTGVTGGLRLMWKDRWGPWDAEVHYSLSATTGDAAAAATALAPFGAPMAQATFFDMTEVISSGVDTIATHRIDRLSLGYSTPNFVGRVGRQALTWGAGMAFHPSDLVAPFSPGAFDTEFKPGVDMIYLQWLLASGADIELIGVPRRARAGGPFSPDDSTLALRYRGSLGVLGTSAILASDHGDVTAALGLSGPLGGATWNAEIVPTRLASGGTRTSGLVNISTGATLFGKAGLVFAEYYHNGFGTGRTGPALSSLSPELTDRLALGQVFTLSRNYLALGLSLELTPLVSLGANTILNLDDHSSLAAAELNWSLTDNANLLVGVQFPNGPKGTEFGGLPLIGTAGPFVGPDRSAYLRYRQYF
ncbi:MAG: hypothetical protein O3A51_00565 [Verrucomicrobia bacterium]|nr:hypothetical protein [Verrucomicrobiota bacterium]